MIRGLRIAGVQKISEYEIQRRIFLVSALVVRHIQDILDQTLIDKGCLCYPIIGSYYKQILGDYCERAEVISSITREATMCLVNAGYIVDTFDTAIRVYIGKKEKE